MKKLFNTHISYHWLICVVSLLITFVLNQTFFTQFYKLAIATEFSYLNRIIQPIYCIILVLLLEILVFSWNAKILLPLVLLLSSICAFYMDSMGIGITIDIIQSVCNTNATEAKDFISMGLLVYIFFFGLLPSIVICSLNLKPKQSILNLKGMLLKFSLICILLASVGAAFMSVGKDIIFVFKAQKSLIDTPNPIAPIRATILYSAHAQEANFKPTFFGLDSKLSESVPPQIVVLFIGESARSKNFTLNGYERETNPYTKSLPLISFQEFYSCGVITAISVPCMLTHYTQKTYTHRNLGLYTNNILDIAQSVGYEVWYLGKNGGKCPGGCEREIRNVLHYNAGEYDEVMLPDFQKIVLESDKAQKYLFIVLHGYGSHGASYFHRYPKDFEHFAPTCRHGELSKCEYNEIVNAYDNSIRYTDWLLSQVIATLQQSSLRSMLWYVSDHGESLGEMGQYMHGGLSYSFAPKAQTHIPSILWFSEGWSKAPQIAQNRQYDTLNHDYVFHTLLHILGIETKDYEGGLDIMKD